ncbi:T9SS type A sorting domain-containing protein [Fluviicola sp.]|uniref:T9SS type A sorting domain-containing protein n=1 Tax=Fluviicola sp. TaxID=1917219 RepID=UPI0031DBDA79
MKISTLLLSVGLSTAAFAQTPCQSGRYASDVYSTVNLTSDIVYGSNLSFSGATTSLTLDFYEPAADTSVARPLIIWVHGGSFQLGTKTDVDVKELSNRFAKKGYACASINYRLGFFPVDSVNAIKAVLRATQDLKASIRFFYKDRATTNTYKIDTTRIFIGGSSAGAITALHVGYLDKDCEIADYIDATNLAALGGMEGASGNPGYSTKVAGVINLCGALGRYSWMEAGDVPLVSVHGTADGTVKYNRGVVNPGVPIMYLDGSRMLLERSCALNHPHKLYTFLGAPHVPYAGTSAAQIAYMDTTANFVRDFLVHQLGCTNMDLQPANPPAEMAYLYPINYCDGSPVNETCVLGLTENTKEDEMTLYPNPASSQVTIHCESEGAKTIAVIDLSGRTVLTREMNTNGYVLSVHDLNKGTYFVRLLDHNTQKALMKQLVIE